MLSKSAARKFFLVGTGLCAGAFLLLTVDTIQRVPKQTNAHNITAEVARGKHLFDKNNCMGCHTIMGEGAYYAPELTKVFERRGEPFIRSMLKDPQAMYPDDRKMQKYDFSEQEITDLVAFLKWVGEIDLNGFPPKPDMKPKSAAASVGGPLDTARLTPPAIFNQMCVACHSLDGSGGTTGPALDAIGKIRDEDYLVRWLKDPTALKADSKMPKLPLSEEDIRSLAGFLSKLKDSSSTTEEGL